MTFAVPLVFASAARASVPVPDAAVSLASNVSAAPTPPTPAQDPAGGPLQWYTSTSRSIRNTDGSVSSYLYTGLTFHQVGGQWAFINPTLTDTGAGSSFASVSGFVPTVVGGTSGQLVTMTLPGGAVTLSDSDLHLSVPGLAPRTNTVSYDNVATDTTLQLTAVNSGVQQRLVLTSAAAPTTFHFHLADPAGVLTGGATQPDGSYAFSGPTIDGYRLTVGAPGAYPAMGMGVQAGDSGSMTMTVTPAGDGYDITESLNPDWLASQSYPIVVDPDLYWDRADNEQPSDCTVEATTVNNDRTTSSCNGGLMAVGSNAGGGVRSLLQFDTSPIPSQATINDAYLGIAMAGEYFGNSQTTGFQPDTLDIYRNGQAWDPSLATWVSATSSQAWTGTLNSATEPTGGGDPLGSPDSSCASNGGSCALNPNPSGWTYPRIINTVQSWVGSPTSPANSDEGLVLVARSQDASPGSPSGYYWLIGNHNTTGGSCGANADPNYAGGCQPYVFVNYTPLAPPAAPTGVTASSAAVGCALVSWNNNAKASQYLVNAIDVDSGVTFGYSPEPWATGGNFCGLPNDQHVYFEVYAGNNSGYGPGTASNTVKIPGPAPGSPSNVTATASDKSVTLAWTAASGATSYNVFLYSSAGGYTGQEVTTSSTTATFGGLINGQSYYAYVQAVNSDGTSGEIASNTVTPRYTGPSTTENFGFGGGSAMGGIKTDLLPEPEGGGDTSKLGCTKGQPKCGEPVDDLTGNLVEAATDLTVPGRGLALAWTRTFNGLAAAGQSSPGTLGYGWTGSYTAHLTVNATTGVVTVSQDDGSTLTYTPSGASYIAAPWVLATLTHNSDGSYTMRTRSGYAYLFNTSGQLVSESDRNGYSTTLSYTSGLLVTVTDPAGRSLTLQYNSAGQVSSVTDPAGRTVGYGYDTAGNLATVTDPSNAVVRYGYDTLHRLVTITDPDGNIVLTNGYDTANRVVQQSDALGNITRFGYSSTSLYPEQTTITLPDGSAIIEGFVNGFLVHRMVLNPDNVYISLMSQAYDTADDIASVTDGDGNSTTMSYDVRGNLLTATDPLNRTTRYTYDSANDLTSSTDPAGVTTTLAYDGNGNMQFVSTPDNETGGTSTTSYDYTDGYPGDVTTITDPDGNTSTIAYDNTGMPTTVTDADGHTVGYTYANSIGWVAATTGAGAGSYTYDGDGRVLTATDADGHVSTSSYDPAGNLTQSVDPDGKITSYSYDRDERLLATTSGYGTSQQATQSVSYDPNGNVATQTSGNGNTTRYTVDALGQVIATIDPLGRERFYNFDTASRLANTNTSGSSQNLFYDPAGQLTSYSYNDGTSASFVYDNDGRRTSMTDGTGTSTYQYNSLGELTSNRNGAGATVSYAHDNAGRTTAVTYPNGKTVTDRYTNAGDLASVTDWLGNTTTFKYNAHDNLSQIDYPDQVSENYGYDTADNLTSVEGWGPKVTVSSTGITTQKLLYGSTYTRDANAQVTKDQPQAPTASSLTPPASQYTYTPLNQLASLALDKVQSSVPSCAPPQPCKELFQGDLAGPDPYTYDKDGNLTGLPDSATLAYDKADQLQSLTIGTASAQFASNARGDRVGITEAGQTVNTYTYNAADQLTSLAADPTLSNTSVDLTTNTYDGDGLRATETVGSGPDAPVNAFSYAVDQGFPMIVADGINNYVYGPDGIPIEQIAPGNETAVFIGHDQQQSTRALLASDEPTILGQYDYSPYGNTIAQAGATTPLQYDGQYHDPDGLYYLRARYYDPSTGQFVTRDPLSALTNSVYGYGGGNPVNLIDPSGLWKLPPPVPEAGPTYLPYKVTSDTLSNITPAAQLPYGASKYCSGLVCETVATQFATLHETLDFGWGFTVHVTQTVSRQVLLTQVGGEYSPATYNYHAITAWSNTNLRGRPKPSATYYCNGSRVTKQDWLDLYARIRYMFFW